MRVSKPARMGIDDSGLNALRSPIQHKLLPFEHSPITQAPGTIRLPNGMVQRRRCTSRSTEGSSSYSFVVLSSLLPSLRAVCFGHAAFAYPGHAKARNFCRISVFSPSRFGFRGFSAWKRQKSTGVTLPSAWGWQTFCGCREPERHYTTWRKSGCALHKTPKCGADHLSKVRSANPTERMVLIVLLSNLAPSSGQGFLGAT